MVSKNWRGKGTNSAQDLEGSPADTAISAQREPFPPSDPQTWEIRNSGCSELVTV